MSFYTILDWSRKSFCTILYALLRHCACYIKVKYLILHGILYCNLQYGRGTASEVGIIACLHSVHTISIKRHAVKHSIRGIRSCPHNIYTIFIRKHAVSMVLTQCQLHGDIVIEYVRYVETCNLILTLY